MEGAEFLRLTYGLPFQPPPETPERQQIVRLRQCWKPLVDYWLSAATKCKTTDWVWDIDRRLIRAWYDGHLGPLRAYLIDHLDAVRRAKRRAKGTDPELPGRVADQLATLLSQTE